MTSYEELITNNIPDMKKLEKYLNVDSLGYLSLNGLKKVLGDGMCTSCFDGKYPVKPENMIKKK